MNFSKLNYILIPATKEERERFRSSRSGKFFRFVFSLYFVFSQEGRVLLFFWLIASMLSINIGFTQYYISWSVMTGLLLCSVVLRRGVSLGDVQLTFQSPPRVTVGDPLHLKLTFRNQSKTHTHQAIRIERPFLPWDGKYLDERPSIQHLAPGQNVTCTVTARFIARGEHHLTAPSARALAPFGLALSPPIFGQELQFLVIPKIAEVGHIDIDTVQRYQPGGVALASVTGESRELIGVRPYRPGDPIRDLHAKTWARIGQPAVREYQQEYFTRIGIIIDTDGGEADEPDFEAMLSLAAGVVAHLSRGEALLDLLVIGEDLHQLTLGRSLGFLEQALDLLACVEPKEGFRPAMLQSQLQGHLTRLSCVIFLTLRWDETRQEFTAWVEHQGTRCRQFQVVDARAQDAPQTPGATVVEVADIQADKELVL